MGTYHRGNNDPYLLFTYSDSKVKPADARRRKMRQERGAHITDQTIIMII